MRRQIRPLCRAQFNTLQFPSIASGREPVATCSLLLEMSSLTGASSLLDNAFMDVPRETVDVPLETMDVQRGGYARDLFLPFFTWAVPSWDLHLQELLGTPCRV
jgi:hypothetical protein